ncbi:SAM-dependent methyltransferase [Actinokineospora inagensis]|uniref:SAM-dependent methyltransferase n=1 Tax=Actinokineospora inagensis TaxID=103730 RepID=UPI00041D5A8B|nr:SAM-dependent methyltransferase [Actinokineospora inagensis]
MTQIDPDQAHPARIYDYLLGGACNFAPDRAFAEEFLRVLPTAADAARINRAFLQRVVRYCASQGVNQFLDLGSGIPTVGNVHETAPGSRVLYVDNDPIAIAHSEIELAETPTARALLGDLREPETILEAAASVLDLSQPIGVLMLAVLHFIPDPHTAVARYLSEIAAGSYVAITHGTMEGTPDGRGDVLRLYASSGSPATPRDREEVARLVGGMEILAPGVVWTPEWRPERDVVGDPAESLTYAVVARKG